MQHKLRLARINIRLLVILTVVVALAGGGFVAAHYVRKNRIAKTALAAGDAAYEQKQWPEAVKQYRLYLSKYPEDPEVLERLALASLAVPESRPDYLQNAIMGYRRLLRMREDDADLYRRLVKLYFQVGDFSEANYIAGRWVSKYPTEPEAREWEARALRALRQPADALQKLKDFFSDPATAEVARKHVRLHEIIAELYLNGEVPAEGSKLREQLALEWMNRAVEENPDSAEAHVQRARLVTQLRRRNLPALTLGDPRADLLEASRLNTPDLRVRLQLADAWLAVHDLERAEAELQAAEQLQHPEYQFEFERQDVLQVKHQLRARLLIESNQQANRVADLPQKAREVADAALAELDTRHRLMLMPTIVNLYLVAKRVDKAEELLNQYEAAVEDQKKGNPELVERVACLKALLATGKNDPFRAIEELEGILRVGNPRDPDVWRLLGYAYLGASQDRRALRAFEQYLTLRQGDTSTALDVTRLHYRLGNWPSVRRLAAELEPVLPNNLDVRLMRLEAAIRLKPSDADAAALLEEVRSLSAEHKDRPELPLLEAMILTQQKRPQEAIARLQQAEKTLSNPGAVTLQLYEFQRSSRDYEAAIATARRAIEQHPGMSIFYGHLADALLLAGRKPEAIQVLEEGVSKLRTAAERITATARADTQDEASRAERRRLLNESRNLRLKLARYLRPTPPATTQPQDRSSDVRIPDEAYNETIRELEGLVTEFFPRASVSGEQLEALRRDSDRNLVIQALRELLQLPPVYRNRERANDLIAKIKQVEGDRGIWWRYEEAQLALRTDSWSTTPALAETVKGRLAEIAELDPGFADVVLQLGRVYVELGESERATELYRRFLDQNPQDDRIVLEYVQLLRMQRREAEARRVLDRVQLRGPLSTFRAALALGQNDTDDALRQLESQLSANPRDVYARVLLAETLASKDLAAALKELDAAEKLAPGALPIAISRARILDAAGKTDEALAFLNAYVEKQKNYDSYLLRGEFLAKLGRYEEAETDFRRLTEFPKLAGKGHLRLGLFHEERSSFDKAIAAYREGISAGRKLADASTDRREGPEFRELQYALVRALIKSRKSEHLSEAEKIIAQLEQGAPGREETRLMSLRAQLYTQRGDRESVQKAVELYEGVVAKDRYDVGAYVQLIQHALRTRDYARAMRLTDQAIGANPETSELLLIKATIEYQVGNNRTAARELAQAVLQSDPQNAMALNLLTMLSLQEGDLEAAESYHARAAQFGPDLEETKTTAARLLERKGRRAEAIELLEAYQRSLPEGLYRPQPLLLLASLYRADKNYERSEAMLQQIERIDPGNLAVYDQRLQILADQRRYAEIRELCQERLKAFPQDGPAVLAAAQHIALSGDRALTTQMIRDVEDFLTRNAQSVEGHLAIAQLAYHVRDLNRAIQAYRSILGIDSFQREALNNLAWILSEEVENPDREEALRHATRGVLHYRDDASLLNTRGVIHFRLGRLDEAERDLKECLGNPRIGSGTRARTLVCLGKIAQQRGDAQLSRDYFQQAEEVDRKHQVLNSNERKELEELLGRSLSKN